MALPENALSSTPVIAAFGGAGKEWKWDKDDTEEGGIAIQDSSGGLLYQTWRAEVSEDLTEIVISDENGFETVWYTGTNITEVSLAFDRSMRPAVAFVEDGTPKLNWFDTSAGQQVTTDFPGANTPRVTHDDKRPGQGNVSDVIFAYIRDGDLCYRQQRDRYEIERVIATQVFGKLKKVYMNEQLRLQFEIRDDY